MTLAIPKKGQKRDVPWPGLSPDLRPDLRPYATIWSGIKADEVDNKDDYLYIYLAYHLLLDNKDIG